MIADVRTLSRDVQQIVYDQELIPYIPADVKDGQRPIVVLEPVRRVWHAPPEPKKDVVFQFKISLADSKPPIWRRIQISDCTLDQLHTYIQAAFGWHDCHLHIFKIAGVDYGDPSVLDDGFGIDDSCKTLLGEILPADGSKMNFLYEYDFGDGWTHKISFEGFKPIDKKQTYPRCTAGKRACPPEDCGGIWGYYHLLEALADPEHAEHDDMIEWSGPIDPDAFDVTEATLAMKRAR
ncbi:MAG: plasmid pRiA4b ORF-3 family protein [Planctomycetes bacterium]|nr:plasmid pRiA4b ORF-3 family protein [Planctomycetota bacterium]